MYCTHLVVALLTFGLLAFQATHISPTWSTWWKVRYFAFLIGFIVVSNVGFIRVAHLLGAEFSADYAFNAGNVVDRLYLCIMTLARLGLGEIVPANPPARAVVLVELAFVPSLILSASVVEMRKWFGNGE
ncbi:MAG TPA: ion channel [Thermoanaerobaculales bacterium]|nr:ion channel [Thermoanaerobaculales bacterium]